jgi:hypothetical protein
MDQYLASQTILALTQLIVGKSVISHNLTLNYYIKLDNIVSLT